jgi:2-C-methyl-D-erythritol 4-phosphate cytidylyltransferase
MKRVSLLLVAAGEGRRMRSEKVRVRKPFMLLCGMPILMRALEPFREIGEIGQAIVAVHPEDLDYVRARFWRRLSRLGVADIVGGGERRQDSVRNALRAADPGFEFVAVHDAARPIVSPSAVRRVIRAAFACGAAILAVPVADTVKLARNAAAARSSRRPGVAFISATTQREGLWLAQTPQVFRKKLLARGLELAEERRIVVSDDAQAVEMIGKGVAIVPGDATNIKVTTPLDLRIAAALLGVSEKAGCL